MKQLQAHFKAQYCDHKTKRDGYLLSEENLAQDVGEEDKANTIRNIKTAECRNQCCRNYRFHQETGIYISTSNQSNTNPRVMEN